MKQHPQRRAPLQPQMAAQTPNAKQPKKKIEADLLTESKILSFRERIARAEQTIAASEECRNALAQTDVVGLSVTHKTFGSCIVIEQLPLSITVKFDFGCKRFIMPSAFVDSFLTTEAPEINSNFSQH